MKKPKEDVIKWSPKLAKTFHLWEVMIPIGGKDELRLLTEKFVPEEYDTPAAQRDAMFAFLNECKAAGQEYFVFCDDRLVDGL